jgi:hypothetical protein
MVYFLIEFDNIFDSDTVHLLIPEFTIVDHVDNNRIIVSKMINSATAIYPGCHDSVHNMSFMVSNY